MSAYAIRYECDYKEQRSRLSTFFRLLLCIPHLIVVCILGIAAWIAVVIAWFAIMFTGKYPQGLYDFNAGFLRFLNRFNGYYSLATDDFPSFGLGEDSNYPVRAKIAPPLREYDRLKTGLRLILGIPVWIIAYVLQLVGSLAAFAAWFYIVITGRQHEALQNGINLSLSYTVKAYGYFMLLTEDWPPISASDDDTAAALPVAPPPTSTVVGAAPEATGAPVTGQPQGPSSGNPLSG